MRIETERLALRPFALGDVDVLHALFVLPDVRRYLWDDVAIGRDVVEGVVEASREGFSSVGYGFFRVERRAGPAAGEGLVGFAGLRDWDDPEASGPGRPEVLYGLDPRFWRQGLAFEAAVAVLRFGFDECGLPAIDGGIDPPNVRSRSVLERLGFAGWRRLEVGGLPADYATLARDPFRTGPHAGAPYALDCTA